MASQSTKVTSNEASKHYVIDPDQYPISTLSITYRVQQLQCGPYIDFDGDNNAKLTVPNASQPQAHYLTASNVGKDDERYIESEWLVHDRCQRIARRFLLRRKRKQTSTDDIQMTYFIFAGRLSTGRMLLLFNITVISVSGWPNTRHRQTLMALCVIFIRRKYSTWKGTR